MKKHFEIYYKTGYTNSNCTSYLSLLLTRDHSHLILADKILAVDPRVVLHVKLCAVLSFAKEDFTAARMYFRILGNIIDSALINRPTIILFIMLLHLLKRIRYRVRALNQILLLLALLDECLRKNSKGYRDWLNYLLLVISRLWRELWLLGCPTCGQVMLT